MSFPGLTLRTVSPLRRVGSKAKKKSPMIGGFFALVAGERNQLYFAAPRRRVNAGLRCATSLACRFAGLH
jgi:hypothetical protein